MKTVNIKGTEYVEVHERIKFFRESSDWKNCGLITDIVELTPEYCVLKVSVIDESGRVVSNGIAREKNGDSFINKTSYVENCETSARGRALAGLAIGIDGSAASADEVKNAILQRSKPSPKDTPPTEDEKDTPPTADEVVLKLASLTPEGFVLDDVRVREILKPLYNGDAPIPPLDKIIAGFEKKYSSEIYIEDPIPYDGVKQSA